MVTRKIDEDEIITIERHSWADNFFRPLLIVIMIMCLNLSIVNLVRVINPAWSGAFFLLGMLLTTIEAIYSYRVLQNYLKQGVSTLRYRLAEAAVLILILKILYFMGKPVSMVGQEIQALWQAPLIFFNNEFMMLVILAFLAWGMATQTIADFETLYDPYVDNRMTLEGLTERFFWGGGLLVLVSGITQWIALSGVSSLIDLDRPSLTGVIFNVLVYFMAGLILISQVNLTRLLIRWQIQKTPVASGLARQWAQYGLIFLGLVTLIAFLLPTEYTLGLLATIGFFVQFLINIFIFLLQLLIILITLPLSWLLSLFGVEDTGLAPSSPPAPPPDLGPSGAGLPSWLELLRSLVFWGLTLAILGYLIKTYLDDHPELLQQFKRFKPLAFIFDLFSQLWSWLRQWTQAGMAMLPRRKLGGDAASAAGLAAQSLSWLNLRRLTPRERILYYYLNTLRRAEQKGAVREKDQTPYEYEPRLARSAPEVQVEIRDLTDSFVQARYSQEEIGEDQATFVQKLWQKIRRVLRHRRSEDNGRG
jgi:hypothetical protein